VLVSIEIWFVDNEINTANQITRKQITAGNFAQRKAKEGHPNCPQGNIYPFGLRMVNQHDPPLDQFDLCTICYHPITR
jgi:hypothetical protein